MARRLLVVQVAGLGHDFLVASHGSDAWGGLKFRPAASVFPALTCPVQASVRTAAPASSHGMVFNGHYSRPLRRPSFWEQSSALVAGPRVWDELRAAGKRVGMLFWQQSLGEQVDVLLSPAPIHKHHGGMIDAVYSRPAGLYDELVRRVGRRFKLMSYWGPLASAKSSQWIADATAELLTMPEVMPDLLFTYLPHLDYALLRHGPSSPKAAQALADTETIVRSLAEKAVGTGCHVVVFGDYAFGDVRRVLYPNRLLRERKLLAVRDVRGRLYPDLHASGAFAVVDHEVAHVYVQDPKAIAPATEALRLTEGIAGVFEGRELEPLGIAHANAGEIVLVADKGTWFAYPWWDGKAQQPDYATHVDIHNKPGFDPCELFFGWPPPFATSTDASRIKGSHGRVGKGRDVAVAATCDLPNQPKNLVELAAMIRTLITQS